MPYPNYHAARLRAPGDFSRIRVLQTSKEGIMFYGGPLKSKPSDSTELQAIRFPKSKFSADQAKKWLTDHKHKTILFEPATEKEKTKKGLWPSLLKGISWATGGINGKDR